MLRRSRCVHILLSQLQHVHCLFVCFLCGFSFVYSFPFLFFCCLDLPPLGASLLMNGFDLTACLELNLLLYQLNLQYHIVYHSYWSFEGELMVLVTKMSDQTRPRVHAIHSLYSSYLSPELLVLPSPLPLYSLDIVGSHLVSCTIRMDSQSL